jgi:hypothetical protein
MAASYPARTAVPSGNYVLELKDVSAMPHPDDDDALAIVWDYQVALGPNGGKPVQVVIPANRIDHKRIVKQHFEKGYAKNGGDTHRRALVGRRVIADVTGNLVTLSRYDSDLDTGRLSASEIGKRLAMAESDV